MIDSGLRRSEFLIGMLLFEPGERFEAFASFELPLSEGEPVTRRPDSKKFALLLFSISLKLLKLTLLLNCCKSRVRFEEPFDKFRRLHELFGCWFIDVKAVGEDCLNYESADESDENRCVCLIYRLSTLDPMKIL